MPFESLSNTHEFVISGFPEQWLPLTYLYDPDLPLFPIYYFHVLDPVVAGSRRPGEGDRAYGFVQRVAIEATGAKVTIAVNKNFGNPVHAKLKERVEEEVGRRLGVMDPVELDDLKGCFSGPLAPANAVLEELWYKTADSAFGKRLPFGALWDPLFGLARFIASFNSDGGRKGELIQTHYFMLRFGTRIATGGGIHADFYLLPTYEEFRDSKNPLALFPRVAELILAAAQFVSAFCESAAVGSMRLSAFRMASAKLKGSLNTDKLHEAFAKLPQKHGPALMDLYSAFNRGPARSILAIMMIHDLRVNGWNPESISRADAALLYTGLDRSYQSPKVMHLYAQLCFGNRSVLPIDNWIGTVLRWPLGFGKLGTAATYAALFDSCAVWGKVERLIWMAAQARKVHSSVCESILWCIRYGDSDNNLRGAGPLSCKICDPRFRDACASYGAIKDSKVSFNRATAHGAVFDIQTSGGDNSTLGQHFLTCSGTYSTTANQRDEYSVRDRPGEFHVFPAPRHDGDALTVEEFIEMY